MQIMFISKNKFVILPVVPYITDIEQEQTNEEMQTINGIPLNLKGGKTLRKFSISSFFPNKKYEFLKTAFLPASVYLNFFLQNTKEPVRVIVISKSLIILNMLCRYSFSYNITDRAGDVPYTLDITEYVDPKLKRSVINDYFL